MKSKARIVFTRATAHEHIVGLLKADSVAVIIAHDAIFDDRPEAAIQKDSRASATVQRNVLSLVAINREVLHTHIFQIVPADDWKHRRRLRLVGYHAIGIEWLVD
jgi:hypothetical protein